MSFLSLHKLFFMLCILLYSFQGSFASISYDMKSCSNSLDNIVKYIEDHDLFQKINDKQGKSLDQIKEEDLNLYKDIEQVHTNLKRLYRRFTGKKCGKKFDRNDEVENVYNSFTSLYRGNSKARSIDLETTERAIVLEQEKCSESCQICEVTKYVDFKSGNNSDNGDSWEKAYQSIPFALDSIRNEKGRKCLYVKQGLLKVQEPIVLDFSLSIMGSFRGTENNPDQRSSLGSTAQEEEFTILDGEQKLCHVVEIYDADVVFDGFLVRGGQCAPNSAFVSMYENIPESYKEFFKSTYYSWWFYSYVWQYLYDFGFLDLNYEEGLSSNYHSPHDFPLDYLGEDVGVLFKSVRKVFNSEEEAVQLYISVFSFYLELHNFISKELTINYSKLKDIETILSQEVHFLLEMSKPSAFTYSDCLSCNLLNRIEKFLGEIKILVKIARESSNPSQEILKDYSKFIQAYLLSCPIEYLRLLEIDTTKLSIAAGVFGTVFALSSLVGILDPGVFYLNWIQNAFFSREENISDIFLLQKILGVFPGVALGYLLSEGPISSLMSLGSSMLSLVGPMPLFFGALTAYSLGELCEFYRRDTSGGGIYVSLGSSQELHIRNTIFQNNSAQFGGALYLDTAEKSRVFIEKTSFKHNEVLPHTGWLGYFYERDYEGAIYKGYGALESKETEFK